jgi:hypothetical protein
METAAGRPPSKIRGQFLCYFFSSVVTDGGGAVAVGAVGGAAAGGCGGGSPRMPSLNSRTPCPRPFIISGIFFPPKRTSTTTARIKRCIGLSNIETYLSHPADRARRPKPTISGACCHTAPLRRAPQKAFIHAYSITRSSPARRVTCSRSRCSSSGIAYLRLIPASSLNAVIGRRLPFSLLYFASSPRSCASAWR